MIVTKFWTAKVRERNEKKRRNQLFSRQTPSFFPQAVESPARLIFRGEFQGIRL
jgi:hypothetical protein